MKKILIAIGLAVAVSVTAQSPSQAYRTAPGAPSGTEERYLKGVTKPIQDDVLRANWPVLIPTNLQPVLIITNQWEGQYIVSPTNAELSAAFTIQLPNPTNHPGRRIVFHTPDGCHIVLSNASGGFKDVKTFGVSNVVWLVTSNKVTTCYSTGTNYWVKVQ